MKKLLIALCCLLFIFSSQGPNNPQTMSTAATGDASTDWLNKNNAEGEDGVSATEVLDGTLSNYLIGTNFNFSISAGATINGILAEFKCAENVGGTITINSCSIVIGGTVSGEWNTNSDATNLTSTLTYYSSGSSTDPSVTPPTVSQINASNFGFGTDYQNGSPSTVSVDAMRMTIYYTTAGGAGTKHHVVGESGKVPKIYLDKMGISPIRYFSFMSSQTIY